jgi:hypothetical protein
MCTVKIWKMKIRIFHQYFIYKNTINCAIITQHNGESLSKVNNFYYTAITRVQV